MSAPSDAEAKVAELRRRAEVHTFHRGDNRDTLVERIAFLEAALAASEADRAALERRVAEVRAETLEAAAKIADRHWDGMVVPEARGCSEIAAEIRALTPGASS